MSRLQWASFFTLFVLLMTLSMLFLFYGLWPSSIGTGVAGMGVILIAADENRRNK